MIIYILHKSKARTRKADAMANAFWVPDSTANKDRDNIKPVRQESQESSFRVFTVRALSVTEAGNCEMTARRSRRQGQENTWGLLEWVQAGATFLNQITDQKLYI